MNHEQIIGIHDLIIHDYGPGRMMISLHAEVSSKNDFFEIVQNSSFLSGFKRIFYFCFTVKCLIKGENVLTTRKIYGSIAVSVK